MHIPIHQLESILSQAGEKIIFPAFGQLTKTQTKSDGSVVTQTDLSCQNFIRDQLRRLAPDIPLLGEEMPLDEQQRFLRGDDDYYWCLDPLDGTTNFVSGFPVFSISLALMQGKQPVLACIHDPLRQETFTSDRKEGARLNGDPIRATAPENLKKSVGFIDFKRLPEATAARLATGRIYRSQRNIGSCALEWAWLAAGRAHFIVHGGEKIWDFAAGSLLADAAGCTVTDFAGQPLLPLDSLVSPIVACASKALHRQLLPHLEADTGFP